MSVSSTPQDSRSGSSNSQWTGSSTDTSYAGDYSGEDTTSSGSYSDSSASYDDDSDSSWSESSLSSPEYAQPEDDENMAIHDAALAELELPSHVANTAVEVFEMLAQGSPTLGPEAVAAGCAAFGLPASVDTVRRAMSSVTAGAITDGSSDDASSASTADDRQGRVVERVTCGQFVQTVVRSVIASAAVAARVSGALEVLLSQYDTSADGTISVDDLTFLLVRWAGVPPRLVRAARPVADALISAGAGRPAGETSAHAPLGATTCAPTVAGCPRPRVGITTFVRWLLVAPAAAVARRVAIADRDAAAAALLFSHVRAAVLPSPLVVAAAYVQAAGASPREGGGPSARDGCYGQLGESVLAIVEAAPQSGRRFGLGARVVPRVDARGICVSDAIVDGTTGSRIVKGARSFVFAPLAAVDLPASVSWLENSRYVRVRRRVLRVCVFDATAQRVLSNVHSWCSSRPTSATKRQWRFHASDPSAHRAYVQRAAEAAGGKGGRGVVPPVAAPEADSDYVSGAFVVRAPPGRSVCLLSELSLHVEILTRPDAARMRLPGTARQHGAGGHDVADADSVAALAESVVDGADGAGPNATPAKPRLAGLGGPQRHVLCCGVSLLPLAALNESPMDVSVAVPILDGGVHDHSTHVPAPVVAASAVPPKKLGEKVRNLLKVFPCQAPATDVSGGTAAGRTGSLAAPDQDAATLAASAPCSRGALVYRVRALDETVGREVAAMAALPRSLVAPFGGAWLEMLSAVSTLAEEAASLAPSREAAAPTPSGAAFSHRWVCPSETFFPTASSLFGGSIAAVANRKGALPSSGVAVGVVSGCVPALPEAFGILTNLLSAPDTAGALHRRYRSELGRLSTRSTTPAEEAVALLLALQALSPLARLAARVLPAYAVDRKAVLQQRATVIREVVESTASTILAGKARLFPTVYRPFSVGDLAVDPVYGSQLTAAGV